MNQQHQPAPLSDVETLAVQLHVICQAALKRQGNLGYLVSYADCEESSKEVYRAMARFILERESTLCTRLEQVEGECLASEKFIGSLQAQLLQNKDAILALSQTKGRKKP